jgi:hypothetical protein
VTTLSLERIARATRRHDSTTTAWLKGFMAKQAAVVRTSFDAAAAYEGAETSAARRAVLRRFADQIGR